MQFESVVVQPSNFKLIHQMSGMGCVVFPLVVLGWVPLFYLLGCYFSIGWVVFLLDGSCCLSIGWVVLFFHWLGCVSFLLVGLRSFPIA